MNHMASYRIEIALSLHQIVIEVALKHLSICQLYLPFPMLRIILEVSLVENPFVT